MNEGNDKKDLPHVRRVRYKGSYPKNYREKYKELEPDRYASAVQKVLNKGNTPAGMHIPIMQQEILDFLAVRPGMKGMDATLGYGGHSEKILERLTESIQNSAEKSTVFPAGHLIAADVDPIESRKTEDRLRLLGYGENILTIRHTNFSNIDLLAGQYGPFDFVLADLGVSSMQIDNPDRGFSWKADGPLDLRMDPEKGITGAERLKELTQDELEGMLRDNADEPYAFEIAKQISADLKHKIPVETTLQLHAEIIKALKKVSDADRAEEIKKSSARTFQALRIDINHEYESLYTFLEKLPGVLTSGGKAAILTFHSGEDRLVKKSFRENFRTGIYREISEDVIRSSAEEIYRNSRARSAKFRWAIRA